MLWAALVGATFTYLYLRWPLSEPIDLDEALGRVAIFGLFLCAAYLLRKHFQKYGTIKYLVATALTSGYVLLLVLRAIGLVSSFTLEVGTFTYIAAICIVAIQRGERKTPL